MKTMLSRLSIIILILNMIGCQKDQNATSPPPSLHTTAISAITSSTASSGGEVTDDGGASIIARGIVWDTSSDPTISLSTKTSDGVGTGSFSSTLTGLSPGSTYYTRAYASNANGTGYGNEISFQTDQTEGAFTALDNAIASKINQYSIPGLTLAIVKDEKLVYLKSYGFADKESNQLASNDNLWRIASISKPITAIAILKLVQDGLITLDQKVFGSDGILGNEYGSPPVGSSKDLITVRHLLNHTSGWTNSPNDPMFSNINNTQKQVITTLLANRSLTTLPGQTYYYLNFGYCVLGRVIEKITNMTYNDYVQSLLTPMGITNMKIGGNTLNDRLPNEVKYYQAKFSPYAMNVTRMDAHGGWVASSKDLARFITNIDRKNSVPDIISPALLNQFYFGYSNWVFYGSLPGTSSILNRLNDTFSFAVIANTRTENDGNIILNDLNSTVSEQINARDTWPIHDLFD